MKTIQTTRSYFIDQEAKKAGVKFQAAEIHDVTVKSETPELETFKQAMCKTMTRGEVGQNQVIQGYRNLFDDLGIKGFAASPELLHQLFKKHGQLPKINSIVDSYNIKSLEFCIVISAHDLDQVVGDVGIRMNTGNEIFYPLGKPNQPETLPLGEWAGVAENHVLCRLNCKQSNLSKVTPETKNLLIYVQGNRNTTEEELRHYLQETCECIVKFNGGEYALLPEWQT